MTTEAKRILIIDDDRLVLETLTKLFLHDSWQVDACANGEEGLEKVRSASYECLLMDIRMPGMTGPQVLSKIRDLEHEKVIDPQKVIFMTGFSDEQAPIKAFGLGACQYVYKPLDARDLLQKANACVAAKKILDQYGALAEEDLSKELKQIRKLYDRESIDRKADILAAQLHIKLKHIKGCTYDPRFFQGNIENPFGIIQIPLGVIGPITIKGKHARGDFMVPMATTEGALLLTYDLGSRLCRMAEPIETEVVSKVVHISPMFPIKTNEDKQIAELLDREYESLKAIAESGSSHTKLLGIDRMRIGDNYVLKFKYDTMDAHGLNMINQASYNACKFIRSRLGFPFYHRSHYSGVKHHAALNERAGYGRVVRARAHLTSKALAMLKVSAPQMKDFFDRCTECGQAAGILSVNVHAANAITAIFMACGQDVADLSSSHVCATSVQLADEGKGLIVECVLRNLLVATVGGGTGLGTQSECLNIMGCLGTGKSDQFAEIVAATVLAGEFPTAAAVISETYVDIHNKYGRNKAKLVP
ncbi:MAG: response regulator [Candidatus Omnitrophota bacterium]|jgi:hydroxymethylglutaryl-CoA reductase (NADPH)